MRWGSKDRAVTLQIHRSFIHFLISLLSISSPDIAMLRKSTAVVEVYLRSSRTHTATEGTACYAKPLKVTLVQLD